jgi:hypothetical protein
MIRRMQTRLVTAAAAILMLWTYSAQAQNVFKSGQDLPPGGSETTIGNSSVVVRTVTGTVEEDKRYLSLMDDIYRNELVETFNESATEITFLDESTLTLGPDSSIVLDRFVYDPDKTTNEFVISVTEGVFRLATGTMKDEDYKVRTPVATIGVRGTVIEVSVERPADLMGAASVELTVLEGEAFMTPCRGDLIVVPQGATAKTVDREHDCP